MRCISCGEPLTRDCELMRDGERQSAISRLQSFQLLKCAPADDQRGFHLDCVQLINETMQAMQLLAQLRARAGPSIH